jgi:hypothetical protein
LWSGTEDKKHPTKALLHGGIISPFPLILPSNEQESTADNSEFPDSGEFPESGVTVIESNSLVDSPLLVVHTYKKHKGQLEDTPQFPMPNWNDSPVQSSKFDHNE